MKTRIRFGATAIALLLSTALPAAQALAHGMGGGGGGCCGGGGGPPMGGPPVMNIPTPPIPGPPPSIPTNLPNNLPNRPPGDSSTDRAPEPDTSSAGPSRGDNTDTDIDWDRGAQTVDSAVPAPSPLPDAPDPNQSTFTVSPDGGPARLDPNVARQLVPGGGAVQDATVEYNPATGYTSIAVHQQSGADVMILVRPDGTSSTTVFLPSGNSFNPADVNRGQVQDQVLGAIITTLDAARTAGQVATTVISLVPGVGTATSTAIQALQAGADAYHDAAMADVNAGRDINQGGAFTSAAGAAAVNTVINLGTGAAVDRLGGGSGAASALTGGRVSGQTIRAGIDDAAAAVGGRIAGVGNTMTGIAQGVSGTAAGRAGIAAGNAVSSAGNAIVQGAGDATNTVLGNFISNQAGNAVQGAGEAIYGAATAPAGGAPKK